jgi:hypothetical protein
MGLGFDGLSEDASYPDLRHIFRESEERAFMNARLK